MVITPYSSVTSPACKTALAALNAGISVLPIRPDGSKQPALSGWREYQQELPYPEEVEEWFTHPRRGLALVTGSISGGLIALDFDDSGVFDAWRDCARVDRELGDLYRYIAEGYEERTPKGGRHLLFRCPEAFQQDRKPGNQKLALRAVPPPKRFETLGETREEGGLIIVYPSHGNVHPSGRSYYLLRGSVVQIKTITAAQREQLYNSVRAFDETPDVEPCQETRSILPVFYPGRPTSPVGERPGDLFMSDPTVTWESLLVGWDISDPQPNRDGYLERYLRHPGKVGFGANATLNADGTDRLFVFSPSPGLPMNRYFNKFEFYAYWYWGGDFTQATRALAEMGYTNRKKA
ncbi:MAG: bifunctional DNA primase/polymerase [Ktedonobacteraceae bacterium]|nr:bifunctional DNA primase/polymerase [Ktedonobacteraceae bacterium]